jgi:hypothetical protein
MILLLILTRDHIAASILAAFSRKAGIRQK